jgi:hypothetical protein
MTVVPFNSDAHTINHIPNHLAVYQQDVYSLSESRNASFIGENPGDNVGEKISGAGDVNGDGYADFLVATPQNDEGGTDAGKVYLILGRSANKWTSDQSLNLANASFLGENPFDRAGSSVSEAGDVNADGYDDFIIGASNSSENGEASGKAYLIFGHSSIDGSHQSLSTADVQFIGEGKWNYTGAGLSGVGDVNNDGYDDTVIASILNSDGDIEAGQSYLIFGRPSSQWLSIMYLSQANASFLGETSADQSGFHISGVGDVNNDEFDDFLIGGLFLLDFDPPLEPNAEQKVYLILGRSTDQWNMDTSLSQANASFIRENWNEGVGQSFSGVGDINGDNYNDFIIGAPYNDEFGRSAGQTYVIFGRPTNQWMMGTSLSQVNGSFIGELPDDYSGGPNRLAGIGDVNGDGYYDFVVGARGNDDAGSDSGKTYLILGTSQNNWNMDLSLGIANASFLGEASADQSGTVAAVGDVDGNGVDDFIIGAHRNDEGGDNAGQVYLILQPFNLDYPLETSTTETTTTTTETTTTTTETTTTTTETTTQNGNSDITTDSLRTISNILSVSFNAIFMGLIMITVYNKKFKH